jgi:hypothetical protein
VLNSDEVPVRKRRRSLPGDCSGWKMAGGIFLTVTRGDGGWLCHVNDVPAYRDRRDSMGVQEFLRDVVVLLEQSARNRSCWMSWTYGRRRWS